MVRPNREVQLNVQVQDWKRGSINIIKIVSVMVVVNVMIQVGVFVNSVPARVRMTVCDSGNLNFQNSFSGSDNQLSHEDLQELNLKPGENKARWVKLTLSKKARVIVCSFFQSHFYRTDISK